MSRGLLFWVLMILWVILGIYVGFGGGYLVIGGNVLLFILLALLGWGIYGPPIHG
jgi:hypothetical protein